MPAWPRRGRPPVRPPIRADKFSSQPTARTPETYGGRPPRSGANVGGGPQEPGQYCLLRRRCLVRCRRRQRAHRPPQIEAARCARSTAFLASARSHERGRLSARLAVCSKAKLTARLPSAFDRSKKRWHCCLQMWRRETAKRARARASARRCVQGISAPRATLSQRLVGSVMQKKVFKGSAAGRHRLGTCAAQRVTVGLWGSVPPRGAEWMGQVSFPAATGRIEQGGKKRGAVCFVCVRSCGLSTHLQIGFHRPQGSPGPSKMNFEGRGFARQDLAVRSWKVCVCSFLVTGRRTTTTTKKQHQPSSIRASHIGLPWLVKWRQGLRGERSS